MLDENKVVTSLGEYVRGDVDSVTDPRVKAVADTWKKYVSARFTPVTGDQLDSLPHGKYHISIKYDGQYFLYHYKDGEHVFCNSPKHRGLRGLPAGKEMGELMAAKGVREAFVVTELYVESGDGRRTRVHDLTRALSNPTEERLEGVRAAVHDLMEVDGERYGEKPYSETYDRITELFGDGSLARPVPTAVEGDRSTLKAQYQKWVEQEGHEGVVARHETMGTYKVKPVRTVDAVVVGFAEGNSKNRGKVGTLLTALMRRDGTYQVLAHVGGGLTDEQRDDLMSELSEQVVPSQYTAATSDGRAFRMVSPTKVIEVEYVDALPENTRGDPVRKPVLHYAQGWEVRQEMPLASLISPRFVRLREDKGVTPDDLRLEQLAEFVEIGDLDAGAEEIELAESEVLLRSVFTKGGAEGPPMVRKALLLDTRKGREEGFMRYVLFGTDFSPKRKAPLKTELSATDDWEQVQELFTSLTEKMNKKGWEELP